MPSSSLSALRRAAATAILALAALAFLPVAANAATPATLRLLGTDPIYGSTTVTMPNGTRISSAPGLFRLRITPAGGAAVERRGFCVNELHLIARNVDYPVVMRTAADDARLATPRYAEAAWLIQQAEGLIAAAAPDKRALEAGALQAAVWQLTDQAREVNPTSDAVLNARTAALRALAAGKRIGGPVTITPAMPRGCAGRSAVTLTLTGTPGSTATLAVSAGAGTVSPAQVTFAANGTAQAYVTSSTPGAVSVTARSEGGTLTRIGAATPTASSPQETMVLVPQSHSATATVTFDDCPVIPLEEPPTTPNIPTTPTSPDSPVAPLETPAKPAVPGVPATPTTPSTPLTPTQTPRFGVTKRGPATVRAGATARYTITVVNRGAAALRDLTLTDILPEGMSLTSTPAGSRLRGGKVVWSLSSLAPGARRVLHVGLRIDADASGRRCNRAVVTTPGGGRRTATACTVVTAVTRTVTPAVTA